MVALQLRPNQVPTNVSSTNPHVCQSLNKMSLPEKVLMRKIKKREKRKQELSEKEPEKKKAKQAPSENGESGCTEREACKLRLTCVCLV